MQSHNGEAATAQIVDGGGPSASSASGSKIVIRCLEQHQTGGAASLVSSCAAGKVSVRRPELVRLSHNLLKICVTVALT